LQEDLLSMNHKARSASILFIVLALLTVCPGLLTKASMAQVTTATIGGTVRDESGGVVPDATVKVTNAETISDPEGRYRFGSLPVGRYELKAERAGFRTGIWKDIALDVG
jgi:protocatechuate 3,4-dioxygenase beta subunit